MGGVWHMENLMGRRDDIIEIARSLVCLDEPRTSSGEKKLSTVIV